MNIRKYSIAALTIAAAISPAISTASPERASLAGCAHAFAAALAGTGAAAPKYRIDLQSDAYPSTITAFYAREYSYSLQARDSKTGATLARATCTAKRNGEVKAFSRLPDADAATLAAR
jgi:hypothetical protein